MTRNIFFCSVFALKCFTFHKSSAKVEQNHYMFWILQNCVYNAPSGHPQSGQSKAASNLLCSCVPETVFYWPTGALHWIRINFPRSFHPLNWQVLLFGIGFVCFLVELMALFVYPQMALKTPGRQDGSVPNLDVCLKDWARKIVPKISVLTILLKPMVCQGSRYVTRVYLWPALE